jgi:hypothetical protein
MQMVVLVLYELSQPSNGSIKRPINILYSTPHPDPLGPMNFLFNFNFPLIDISAFWFSLIFSRLSPVSSVHYLV